MDNLKNVEIDGIEFQIKLMGAMKALVLDRKILAIILPTVSGIAEQGLDTEIGVSELLKNVGDGLMKLSDSDYKQLLLSMFSEVIAVAPGKAAVVLDSEESFNAVFSKKIITAYKLFLEVMRHNEFSVFGMAGGGFGIETINMLAGGKSETSKTGSKLETSGN